MLPNVCTTPLFSQFVPESEQVMRKVTLASYKPTEPHLWLVAKIPAKTRDDGHKTFDKKLHIDSCDEL